MPDEKNDRRVQRTKRLLQGALVELIKEKGYDNLTVQDITDRADVGRTTFYLHYQSKEDLLLEHHANLQVHFSLSVLNYQQLMGDEALPEMVEFLEVMAQNRPMYLAIRAAKESVWLLRGIQEQITMNLQVSLKAVFPDVEPSMPLELLTLYIAGAQLSLIHWWMTNRSPYDTRQMADTLHRLQRAAVRDAYQM